MTANLNTTTNPALSHICFVGKIADLRGFKNLVSLTWNKAYPTLKKQPSTRI